MPTNDNTELVADLETQISKLEGQLAELLGKQTDKDDAAPAPTKKRVKLTKSDDDDTDDASDDDADVAKADDADEATEKKAPVKEAKKAVAKKAKKAEPDEDDEMDDWSGTEKSAPADDETCVVEGQTIRKSQVGEASFAILKGQADKLAKMQSTLDAEVEKRVTAEFEKQADELFKNLPGTTTERGALLKSLDKMPKDQRALFEKIMTSHSKLVEAAFEKVGINPLQSEELRKSAQSFEAKIKEIAKRDSVAEIEAMKKARVEDPEGFAAYQESGPTRSN